MNVTNVIVAIGTVLGAGHGNKSSGRLSNIVFYHMSGITATHLLSAVAPMAQFSAWEIS